MTDYEFTQYRRKQIAELRPYIEGEDVSHVSISPEDAKAGSPKVGDMIARNPKNHDDRWLVARAYFLDNFEPLTAAEQTEPALATRSGAVKVVEDTYARYPKIMDRLAALEPAEPAPAAEPVGVGVFRDNEMIGFVSLEGWEYRLPEDNLERRMLYTHPTPSEARLREALGNVIAIGEIAVGSATINRMVSIARAALKEASDDAA